MTSSQIQMNNLVEFYLPIDSKHLNLNCLIPLQNSKLNDSNIQ